MRKMGKLLILTDPSVFYLCPTRCHCWNTEDRLTRWSCYWNKYSESAVKTLQTPRALSLRTHKSEIYKDWAGSLSSGPARLGPSPPLLCGELLLGGPCVLLPSQVGAPWGPWKCCHNTNPPEESGLGLKNFFWELPSFFPGDLPEVFGKAADLLPKNLTRGAAFTIPKVPCYTLPLLALLLPN